MADDSAFDKVMELAGDEGPFQTRFNYIFNAGLVICASMVYMNIILALNVPEHWCHVPGREHTNFSLEEWKHLTLPRLIFYDYKTCFFFSFFYSWQIEWRAIFDSYASFMCVCNANCGKMGEWKLQLRCPSSVELYILTKYEWQRPLGVDENWLGWC